MIDQAREIEEFRRVSRLEEKTSRGAGILCPGKGMWEDEEGELHEKTDQAFKSGGDALPGDLLRPALSGISDESKRLV